MDRDANYVAVGAFVLLVIAMAVVFVFWYTDQQDKRTYQRYEIYFEGSVSGLTEGGAVRYLGVNVGEVKRMTIDLAHRNRVLVIVDIDATAPLDNRTLATLVLQGVTGLLFIDLQQDPNAATAGPLAQGTRYPVIRSTPSDLDVLLKNLPGLATRMVESVDRFNRLLSDSNINSIKKTLENASLASERLPATVRGMEDMAADMRSAAHEVRSAAADLESVTAGAGPDIKAAVANFRVISDHLAVTSQRLDQFIADNGPGISSFTNHSLPELERLLRDAGAAARDIRDLSRSLKENPSQLIYEPNNRGVVVPQ
ncbi:MAG: MlaD family protein [Steroidobacteraceae bacterium]|jgi:phospholipid/cholesterol/gamma-HCH transport system substrate-binding protein